MAIYHLSVQTISRGQGKSCVAAAAYRAGAELEDERQGLTHDYTKKQDIESEIMAPANSPEWVHDRQKLWNEVDRSETRCNSRTAREINIALPLELSKDQQKELVKDYVQENFVDKGMVADVCFHFNDKDNPHCHVMLTTREINQEGFTKKNRDWDKKEKVEEWREHWADNTNRALEKAGCKERIDHRSYKDQGIDQVPTIHLGKTSSEMQKKGIDNPRASINNQIKELNNERVIALQEYKELKAKLEQEKAREAQKYSNLTETEKSTVVDAEKIVGEPLNYKNIDSTLRALKQERQDTYSKYADVRFKPHDIQREIEALNRHKDELRDLKKELEGMPRGIFGGYKDSIRALNLKKSIEHYSELLENDSIRKTELELKKVKGLVTDYDNRLQDLDSKISTLNNGYQALQNKELRELVKDYQDVFPQAKYIDYSGMNSIKRLNDAAGKKVTPEWIESSYNKYTGKLNDINNKLDLIKDNGKRLDNARQALDTIDKTRDVAEKYDTKIIGKEKYQREHQNEKWQHDDAIKSLSKYGVKDRQDLIRQERIQNDYMKNAEPKLKDLKLDIEPKINLLGGALQAFGRAMARGRMDQRKEISKQKQATKGHNKSKDRDIGGWER